MTMSHKFKQDKFLGTCRYCNKPETEHMKNLPEREKDKMTMSPCKPAGKVCRGVRHESSRPGS